MRIILRKAGKKNTLPDNWQKVEYCSEISKEGCIIYQAYNGIHKGEQKWGIISFLNGEITYVEVNRYIDGKSLTKPLEYSQFILDPGRDEELGISINTDTNRGLAHIVINLTKERELDMKLVTKFFCNKCLERLLKEHYSEKPLNVGILDYSIGKIKLITPSTVSFIMGDYYVSCNVWKQTRIEGIKEIHLKFFSVLRGIFD